MKNLNAKIVGSTEVYLPKLAEQDAFIDFASQIDKLRFDDIVVLRLYLKRYRDKYMFYM